MLWRVPCPSTHYHSIHMLLLEPHSLSITTYVRFFTSKTIKRGIPYPDALMHPTTVICALFLDKTYLTFFWPFFVKTYGNRWSSATPDSSTLYIWLGLFIKSFSFSVLLIHWNSFPTLLCLTASKQTMAARSPLWSWSWGYCSKNLLNHPSLICFFFNKCISRTTFSTIPLICFLDLV